MKKFACVYTSIIVLGVCGALFFVVKPVFALELGSEFAISFEYPCSAGDGSFGYTDGENKEFYYHQEQSAGSYFEFVGESGQILYLEMNDEVCGECENLDCGQLKNYIVLNYRSPTFEAWIDGYMDSSGELDGSNNWDNLTLDYDVGSDDQISLVEYNHALTEQEIINIFSPPDQINQNIIIAAQLLGIATVIASVFSFLWVIFL